MISKTDSSIEIVKKKVTYVSLIGYIGSILRFSSSFLFTIRIVRHFNTVNTSDTVEFGYTRIQHVPLSIPRIRWSWGIRRLNTCPARKAICKKQGDVFIPAKWFPKSAYTSMNLRRDRKRSLKFREMLETQEYAEAQDVKEKVYN